MAPVEFSLAHGLSDDPAIILGPASGLPPAIQVGRRPTPPDRGGRRADQGGPRQARRVPRPFPCWLRSPRDATRCDPLPPPPPPPQGPPFPLPPDGAFLEDIKHQCLRWDLNDCLPDVGQCGKRARRV